MTRHEKGYSDRLNKVLKERADTFISALRDMKQSPEAAALFQDAIERARRIHEFELAAELEAMWGQPAEIRYRAETDKNLNTPLARMIEAVALGAVGVSEKLPAYNNKNVITGDGYLAEELLAQVRNVDMSRVRTAYHLLGLGSQIDFIPDIPQPGSRNKLRTETQEFSLPRYGVRVSFDYNSAFRRVNRDVMPSVVVRASRLNPPTR